MIPIAKNLHNLIDLAREGTSEGRRDLLREVTDLFFESSSNLSGVESDLFGDVIGDLVRDMEMEIRAGLAKRLCRSAQAPKNVIDMLANDGIDVAQPVLQNSPVLDSEILVRIIKHRSQEHRLAIAIRNEIDQVTTDALVVGGNEDVLLAVVRNRGAELSRASLGIVVEKSEHNERLQQPLVSRQDLPPEMLHQMFWWVSNALRERILSITENIDPESLDRYFEETEREFVATSNSGGKNASPAQKFIRRKKALGQLNESLILKLIRSGQIPEFIVGLAGLAELDIETTNRIVLDHGGEPLAVACKACGFDRSTFSTLEMLTYRGPARSTQDVFQLLEVYDRVSIDSAKRAIRFWRVRLRASKGDAYWPPRGTDYARTDFLSSEQKIG